MPSDEPSANQIAPKVRIAQLMGTHVAYGATHPVAAATTELKVWGNGRTDNRAYGTRPLSFRMHLSAGLFFSNNHADKERFRVARWSAARRSGNSAGQTDRPAA